MTDRIYIEKTNGKNITFIDHTGLDSINEQKFIDNRPQHSSSSNKEKINSY